MEFSVEATKFSITCRTCLTNDGPFFILKDSDIIHLFAKITELEVLPEDELPQNICQCCMTVFKDMENFIEKCKISDKLLREALLRVSVVESVTEDCDQTPEVEITEHDSASSPYYLNEETDCSSEESSKLKLRKKIKYEQQERIRKKKQASRYMTCGSCGENFDNRKELVKHYNQSETCKENEFKCSNCSKIFSRRHKLQAHMRSHTKESPFQCQICLKSFRFSQNLRRHRKAHDGIKPFVCPICNKAFSRAILKEEHLRIHTGETPFICKYCGKGFKRYNSHHIHVTRHKIESGELPDDKKIFYKQMECNKCDKKFSSKSALRAHEVIHTGEKMFLCNDCGKNFYTKGALQSHYKIHSGAKPYQCPNCEKSFSQKGGLKNHVLTHMGVKPHSCNICNKSFVQSTHLKNHMRTHSGEKPYVCSYCNKSFALNCNLKVHVRTHTGETPYRCPICNMGFYDSSSMKKHQKGHNGVVDKQTTEGRLETEITKQCQQQKLITIL